MENQIIVLGTYGESWDKQHSACVWELRQTFGLTMLEAVGHHHIDIARSLLATAAMDQGADVAFFIDHDMVFDPADVLVLSAIAREKQGVVGAAYSARRMGTGMVGYIDPAEHEEVRFFDDGGLYPSNGAIGMGFTAIHRSVLERIAAQPDMERRRSVNGECVPFFEKLVHDGYWYSEDASFCERARAVGAPCFVETRLRVLHRGLHNYGIEDAGASRAIQPKTITLRLR